MESDKWYDRIQISGLIEAEAGSQSVDVQGEDSETVVPGLYTAGWIKRGPSGVVGTNKPCSEETVAHLLEDLETLSPCEQPDTQAVLDLLDQKGVKVFSFDDWQKIDAAEVERGQKIGKPREKFISVEEMLSAL